MKIIKINNKFQIAIPKKIRNIIGLSAGDTLTIRHKILSMLRRRGLITGRVIELIYAHGAILGLMYTQVAGFIQGMPSLRKTWQDTS